LTADTNFPISPEQEAAINYIAGALQGWQADPDLKNPKPDCVVISAGNTIDKGYSGGVKTSITIFPDRAIISGTKSTEAASSLNMEYNAAIQGLENASPSSGQSPPSLIASFLDNSACINLLQGAQDVQRLNVPLLPQTRVAFYRSGSHETYKNLRPAISALHEYMGKLAADAKTADFTHGMPLSPQQHDKLLEFSSMSAASKVSRQRISPYAHIPSPNKPTLPNCEDGIASRLYRAAQSDSTAPWPESIHSALALSFKTRADPNTADIFFRYSAKNPNYTFVAYAGDEIRIVCGTFRETSPAFDEVFQKTVQWCSDKKRGATTVNAYLPQQIKKFTLESPAEIESAAEEKKPVKVNFFGQIEEQPQRKGNWLAENQDIALKLCGTRSEELKSFTVDIEKNDFLSRIPPVQGKPR